MKPPAQVGPPCCTPLQRPAHPTARRLGDCPSRDGSIAWVTSPGSLTSDGPSNQGMTDRLLDDYGRPRPASYHAEGNTPTSRFDGFCGQLRVTLENVEDWYVTELAPSHFVGTLLRLPQSA